MMRWPINEFGHVLTNAHLVIKFLDWSTTRKLRLRRFGSGPRVHGFDFGSATQRRVVVLDVYHSARRRTGTNSLSDDGRYADDCYVEGADQRSFCDRAAGPLDQEPVS